jgi:class 3 adenylate cyclase
MTCVPSVLKSMTSVIKPTQRVKYFHTTGATLTADISGFTPLTETLRQRFGPRRGAEELSRHRDVVYSALIAEVERYGGSVVGFTGDAIACWFDDANDAASPSRRFVWSGVAGGYTAVSHPVTCACRRGNGRHRRAGDTGPGWPANIDPADRKFYINGHITNSPKW